MAYLVSDTIKVFPAAFRSNAYAESKRTTEENLLKFNKLSSNTANLNQAFLDPDDNTYVIFNIHGYWFRFLRTALTALVGNSLKAYIKLIKDVSVPVGYKLAPTDSSGTLLDDGGSFKGLEFTTGDIPTSSDPLILYYGMQVTNEAGEFISQNLKLDANEIRNSASSNKSISEEFTTETINTTDIVATGNIQASTINITHKLSADNVDDSATTNKFVTSTEKSTWNAKQDALTAGDEISLALNTKLTFKGTWEGTYKNNDLIYYGESGSLKGYYVVKGLSVETTSSAAQTLTIGSSDTPTTHLAYLGRLTTETAIGIDTNLSKSDVISSSSTTNQLLTSKGAYDFAITYNIITTPPSSANTVGFKLVLLDSANYSIASTTQYNGYIYMWY